MRQAVEAAFLDLTGKEPRTSSSRGGAPRLTDAERAALEDEEERPLREHEAGAMEPVSIEVPIEPGVYEDDPAEWEQKVLMRVKNALTEEQRRTLGC